jgi:hypothetical protein
MMYMNNKALLLDDFCDLWYAQKYRLPSSVRTFLN